MNLQRKAVLCVEGIDEVGGIARYVQTLALGLHDKGWDVHILATNFRGSYFDVMNATIRCHDLSGMKLSVGKIEHAAALINELDPNIIVLNHCSLAQYTLPLLKPTVKPVAVVHSDDERFYDVATRCARRVFRWIVPTKGMIGRCQEYLRVEDRRRIEVIPHGIRSNIFFPGKSRDTRITKRIAFVGYLETNKGAHLIPEIFAQVHAAFPGTHCTIVGEGPLLETIQSQIRKRNLLSYCTFTGRLTQSGVADVLRGTDVFISPTEVESFGLAVGEAMLCGAVPVVTHLKGIFDELIEQGKTGVLVSERSADAFGTAVVSLLKDPDRLKRMSAMAAEQGMKFLSFSRMVEEYIRIFEEGDDRRLSPVRGPVGWYLEIAGQLLSPRGVNYKRLGQMARGVLRRTIGNER